MDPQSPVDVAPPEASEPSLAAEPTMSLGQRLAAVFVRPAGAWTGLRAHVQWWFPLVILVVLGVGTALLLHQRATVPMVSAKWEEAVANGQMPAAQAERMEQWFSSPAGMAASVGPQIVIFPIIYLLTALVIWFGVGFILGRPMSYRLALEVACWSGLVTIPAQLLTAVIAWSHETWKGAHVGFGILIPEPETPSKLLSALASVLDAMGPLAIWWLVVAVIGAATLSGAPRKSVGWVLGGLYLALTVLFAGLGAFFSQTS